MCLVKPLTRDFGKELAYLEKLETDSLEERVLCRNWLSWKSRELTRVKKELYEGTGIRLREGTGLPGKAVN